MIINQVRVDLITLYTTIYPLTGAFKNLQAPFSFLTTKHLYNLIYAKAAEAPTTVITSPFNVQVKPICLEVGYNHFWNGARNRSYDGYVGSKFFREVAWNKFLPFLLDIPVTITPAVSSAGTPWVSVVPRIYTWSCGWGVDLRLNAEGTLSLEDLRSRLFALRSELFTLHIGEEVKEGLITTLHEAIAIWIQNHILQPVFPSLRLPIPSPERYGPFWFITIERGSAGPQSVAQLDEESKRLIYAATSGKTTWQSFAIREIEKGFKEIDNYPGSFIFMDRMGRFIWFPPLMTTPDGLNVKLDCYVENTKAATLMMIRLAEFTRLLIQRQNGPILRVNYPLRDLFEHALLNLEQFPSFYINTNLKRMALDLSVDHLLQNGKSLLP